MRLARLIEHEQRHYVLLSTLTIDKVADMTDKNRDAIGVASAQHGNVKAIWEELYGEVYEQIKQAKDATWSGFMSIPKGENGQDGEDVTGIGDLHESLERLLRVIEGYKE